MFQELERRIAEKRAAGIDVISLGIGDPDEPTYPHVVKAMQEAVADPSTTSTRATAAATSSARRSPTSTRSASESRSTPTTR
jgi:aspartate/methionine/tyrosine aminotransferase